MKKYTNIDQLRKAGPEASYRDRDMDATARLTRYQERRDHADEIFQMYVGSQAYNGTGDVDLEQNVYDRAQAYADQQEALTGKWTTKGFKFKDEEEEAQFSQGKKYSKKGRDKELKKRIKQQDANRRAAISNSTGKLSINSSLGYNETFRRLGQYALKNNQTNINTIEAMDHLKTSSITDDKDYKDFYNNYNQYFKAGANKGNTDLEHQYGDAAVEKDDILNKMERNYYGSGKRDAPAFKEAWHTNNVKREGLMHILGKYKYKGNPEAAGEYDDDYSMNAFRTGLSNYNRYKSYNQVQGDLI